MKKHNILPAIIFASIMVFWIIFLIISITKSNNATSLIINVIMLIIAAIFILTGILLGLHPAYKAEIEFDSLTDTIINTSKKDKNISINSIFKSNTEYFSNKLLNEQFTEYYNEFKRIQNSSEINIVNCDINDFINDDCIYTIIKKHYNDQIMGIMTGLGILGTFVGLFFGLLSFDTSSTEAITNSIVPLMEGMKIAFLTSIYGMTFSILYGLLYKEKTTSVLNSLDKFIEEFKLNIVPDGTNQSVNYIIKYQEKQTELLSNVTDQLSRNIGDIMSRNIDIILSKFSQSLNSSNKSNELMENLIDTVKTQNNILNTSLERVSSDIKDTIYSKYTETSKILNNISNGITDNQNKRYESINTLSDKFETLINGVSKNIISSLGTAITSSNSTLNEKISDYVNLLSENQKLQQNSLDSIALTNDNMANTIKLISDNSSTVSSSIHEVIGNQFKHGELLDTIYSGISSSLDEVVKNQLAQCDLLDNVSDNIISSLKNTITSSIYQLRDSLSSSFEDTMTTSNSLLIEELPKEIGLEFGTQFTPALSKLENSIQQFTQIVADNQIKGLANIINSFISEMNKALGGQFKELGNTITELCVLQKESSKHVKTVIDEICKTSKDIKNINQASEDIILNMNLFLDTTTEMQDSLSSKLDLLTEDIKHHSDTVKKQSKYIDNVANYINNIDVSNSKIQKETENLLKKCDNLVNNINSSSIKLHNTFTKKINEFENFIDTQRTQSAKEMKEISNEFLKSAKQMSNKTTELDKGLEKALNGAFSTFDKNMADITRHLSGTIIQIKDIIDNVPKAISVSCDEYRDVIKNLTKETADYVNTVSLLKNSVEKELNNKGGHR